MKKLLAILLAAIMLVSLSACGNGTTSDDSDSTSSTSHRDEDKKDKNRDDDKDKDKEEDTPKDKPEKLDSFEELDEVVSGDIENTIAALNAEYEELVVDLDTYEKYIENIERVEAFYAKTLEETRLLGIRMREYSINYAELVLESDEPYRDKYDSLDIIYDTIYDDACDDIYDEIYDGILDDMYDSFYDGILDDAYDYMPYDDWYDIRSDEYDWWYDTRSDVYDEWYDIRSDVYDFWSDVRGEVWDDDTERAESKIEDFQEDIEKLKKNS
ncbi:MAG: hypothetical protein K2P33_06490 [Acutalibacter sp.]|nr:hypothetical protein [Acutalibacter sp.]